jgi:hypothetical protein
MELHHTAVKEETGFTAVEMLLSLIIVVMITFVGYYIYNTQKNANATYKDASSAAQANVPKSTKKAVVGGKDKPATPFYLVIKEWGVRMTLPDKISDANYSFTRENNTNPDFAGLGVQALTTLSAQCSPEKTTVGAIARQTAAQHDANVTDQAKNGPSIDNEVLKIKVGLYYYGYVHAQAACYDASNTAADSYYTTTKPDVLLKTAVDTLESAN